jgi:hypothetical protein
MAMTDEQQLSAFNQRVMALIEAGDVKALEALYASFEGTAAFAAQSAHTSKLAADCGADKLSAGEKALFVATHGLTVLHRQLTLEKAARRALEKRVERLERSGG